MKYQNLFQKGKIGKLELKNRIVMPAMGVSLATPNGEASDNMIAYYEERAKGGCGLIITEITRIDNEYGVGTPNQLTLTNLNQVPQLERLIHAVHKHDSKLFVQLHHPGRETKSKLINDKQIVAPSAVMCKKTQEMPRALSTEECEGIMKAFVKGAVLAKTAGADGVELHAAHGYLLNQFLSPYTNKRTDKYGGSFTNRIRILAEMITAIKHLCGTDFPISVRISADEFVEGGLKLEDSIKIARTLESYGVDAINVSSGIYESGITIIEPNSYAQGWKKHLASAIRKNVKIPVIAVNNIKTPDVAEQLLEEGVCDFIGVGRALLADPEWSNKAERGESEYIRKCIGCLYCFEELESLRHTKCAVNPRTCRERYYPEFKKNGNGRTVVVVGGGPAGMEAARVLAEREFKVILFEKESCLGGALNMADKPPFKEKLSWLIDSMELDLKRLNVDVRLNTEATVDTVKALNPAGVFIACGANPIVPPIPGIGSANVVKAEDVLKEKASFGKNVVVVGSGMTGLETSEYILDKGSNVTLVEMLDSIGKGVNSTILFDITSRMKKQGIDIVISHKLAAVQGNDVVLVNMNTMFSKTIKADTVVLALGVAPNREFATKFEENFENVKVIGDAVCSGRIAEALDDGFSKSFIF